MRRSWTVLSRTAGSLGGQRAQGVRKYYAKRNVDPFPNGSTVLPQSSLPAFSQLLQSSRAHSSSFYHTQPPHLASRQASGDTSAAAVKEEADAPISTAKEEESLGVRMLKFVGWMGGFYSRKSVLVRASKTLYENCMDNLNYKEFFEVCSMTDSFQSWFMIAHLHVWFFMVRLKREGKDGEYLIRQVVATFWHDVEHRMRAMEIYNSVAATKDFRALVEQFYGLTLAYEEGLLSDDKLLAAAVWRNMIFDKADTDPTQLAKMVDYIRRQVQHMDRQDSKALMERGSISLLPFSTVQQES